MNINKYQPLIFRDIENTRTWILYSSEPGNINNFDVYLYKSHVISLQTTLPVTYV